MQYQVSQPLVFFNIFELKLGKNHLPSNKLKRNIKCAYKAD